MRTLLGTMQDECKAYARRSLLLVWVANRELLSRMAAHRKPKRCGRWALDERGCTFNAQECMDRNSGSCTSILREIPSPKRATAGEVARDTTGTHRFSLLVLMVPMGTEARRSSRRFRPVSGAGHSPSAVSHSDVLTGPFLWRCCSTDGNPESRNNRLKDVYGELCLHLTGGVFFWLSRR
jgi:hypothetical protein